MAFILLKLDQILVLISILRHGFLRMRYVQLRNYLNGNFLSWINQPNIIQKIYFRAKKIYVANFNFFWKSWRYQKLDSSMLKCEFYKTFNGRVKTRSFFGITEVIQMSPCWSRRKIISNERTRSLTLNTE